jgi:hypothetical protein
MKTEPTTDSSKPSLPWLALSVTMATTSLLISVRHIYVHHHYPSWYFCFDMVVLFFIGLQITGYRKAMYNWRQQKAWRDRLNGKDSE